MTDTDDDDVLLVDPGDGLIMVEIAGRWCAVDHAEFLGIHADLADKYRDLGLTGSALDDAICSALPLVLASTLYGRTYH